jgi:hypothetical protein
VERVDTLVLFLTLEEIFSVFSPFSMMLIITLSYILYYVEVHSYFAVLIRDFIIKVCWILSKAYAVSTEMIMWFLSLFLLICCVTFNDLHMLNCLFISRIKQTGSWSFWCVVELNLSVFHWGSSMFIFAGPLSGFGMSIILTS